MAGEQIGVLIGDPSMFVFIEGKLDSYEIETLDDHNLLPAGRHFSVGANYKPVHYIQYLPSDKAGEMSVRTRALTAAQQIAELLKETRPDIILTEATKAMIEREFPAQ